jgi:hypothetical protein
MNKYKALEGNLEEKNFKSYSTTASSNSSKNSIKNSIKCIYILHR